MGRYGGVIVDAPTAELASTTGYVFEFLGEIKVKGKDALIPINKPVRDSNEQEADALGPLR